VTKQLKKEKGKIMAIPSKKRKPFWAAGGLKKKEKENATQLTIEWNSWFGGSTACIYRPSRVVIQ
jgi:hypothetical protein